MRCRRAWISRRGTRRFAVGGRVGAGRLPPRARARARAMRALIESSPRRCMPTVLPVRHGAGLSGLTTGRWRARDDGDSHHLWRWRSNVPGSRRLPGCGSERQERHVPRSLDRGSQRALVPGAGAELATRLDLAALGDVAAQARRVLVVDLPDLVDTESTDLASPTKAATAAP